MSVHYELREFDGSCDVCRVTEDGLCLSIAAEIHDRDLVALFVAALETKEGTVLAPVEAPRPPP